MKVQADISAERAVLAAICQHGSEVYVDVIDMIQESTFTVEYNKFTFGAIKHIFKQESVEKIDIVSLLSAANELGLNKLIEDNRCQQHISSLFNCSVDPKNARRFAAKIRKLQISRMLQETLREADRELQGITGDETVAQILGVAENAIFDFSSLLNDNDEAPIRISKGLVDYVEYLANNPVDQVGISTGFPLWDASIGGGLRKGTINVIGARIKTGKSMIGSNMGYYIANTHNVPVLNLDTEMTDEDHINRLLAMASDCFTYEIETGKFVQKPQQAAKLREAAATIEKKKLPYFHKAIAGMAFEEQLAILRRWIVKEVGLDSQGKAKPCVVVYDYLKLMSSAGVGSGLQEYQLLGFMMSSLHNFAVRYGIPIIMFVQLNRDGIDDEGSGVVSGSDRIGWLCSNLTIFKKKSNEEIDHDGPEHGDRKLVVLDCRHGPGRDTRDYINCHFRGAVAKVVEGDNAFKVREMNKSQESEDSNEPDDIKF